MVASTWSPFLYMKTQGWEPALTIFAADDGDFDVTWLVCLHWNKYWCKKCCTQGWEPALTIYGCRWWCLWFTLDGLTTSKQIWNVSLKRVSFFNPFFFSEYFRLQLQAWTDLSMDGSSPMLLFRCYLYVALHAPPMRCVVSRISVGAYRTLLRILSHHSLSIVETSV